jgi:hypothetical protein
MEKRRVNHGCRDDSEPSRGSVPVRAPHGRRQEKSRGFDTPAFSRSTPLLGLGPDRTRARYPPNHYSCRATRDRGHVRAAVDRWVIALHSVCDSVESRESRSLSFIHQTQRPIAVCLSATVYSSAPACLYRDLLLRSNNADYFCGSESVLYLSDVPRMPSLRSGRQCTSRKSTLCSRL